MCSIVIPLYLIYAKRMGHCESRLMAEAPKQKCFNQIKKASLYLFHNKYYCYYH